MSITTDQKVDFVINLIPLVLAAAKGAQEAYDFVQKSIAALKDGISPEEMDSAIKERDAVLARVVEKTGG